VKTLFRIETDRFYLTWGKVKDEAPVPFGNTTPQPGWLVLRSRRDSLQFDDSTWRAGVPAEAAHLVKQTAGPRLYEQGDYKLFAKAKNGKIRISHRDPLIRQSLNAEEADSLVHGLINFGSQIGRTEFSILINGQPELDFEVEVFPSKLDYASDYENLLAEVQEICTGLAFEYLRATYQKGLKTGTPQPTAIEWLVLLRHVADSLEQALQHIAHHPIRGLTREPVIMRAELVKRVDSSIRAVVRRGRGSGQFVNLNSGYQIRQNLQARQARSTLDTPEHRWLAVQLSSIRRWVGRLRQEETKLSPSERRAQTLQELGGLESRLARLGHLEPLKAANSSTPPAGFASMQLLGAPGYREAYQACLVLALGLRLEGGPIRLSVKDLNLLYEYWCYLALLKLVSEELNQPIPVKKIFSTKQRGLEILLRKGRQTLVPFKTGTGRKIKITYNPQFKGENYLIPQQPDMLITFEERNWPTLHLLLDAKYRLESSPVYQQQYKSPGPPQDALNVLHRYRDAILENEGIDPQNKQLKRTIVQATALFPYREETPQEFTQSRLWQSLDRLGVGAIPLLPGHTDYLRRWLAVALQQGGWALADRTIPHQALEQAQSWRIAASEPVLVATLSSGNEQQHFNWIISEHLYYTPLTKTQRRQYFTRWVAIYLPTALRRPGAVTHYAPVTSIEIKRRDEIITPWPINRDSEELQVVYQLGSLKELSRPIENQAQRFSIHRWTSRLGLLRAKILAELFLETEPEWRLYEDLQANGIDFQLEAGQISVIDPDNPTGRAQFVLHNNWRIRYAGAAGLVCKFSDGSEKQFATSKQIIEKVLLVAIVQKSI
jgi:predicted component of viral defense system (DUF524 family)